MPIERYGLTVFQRFFEKVVELCQAAGLIWGNELYFDGTAVRANADIDKLESRPAGQAQQHVQALFRSDPEGESLASPLGRHIVRSIFQEYIDRVRGCALTEKFKKALCKWQVWVEPLFAEAKQWRQEARFRLRGLHQVNMQGVFTAAGQNLKRWLRWKEARQVRKAAKDTAFLFLWVLAVECEPQIAYSPRLFQHAALLYDVRRR